MRNSHFVFIESRCKSSAARPELQQTPYISLFKSKNSAGDSVTWVFPGHFRHLADVIRRGSDWEKQAEISMPYLQGIMQVSLPFFIDNTTGCC